MINDVFKVNFKEGDVNVVRHFTEEFLLLFVVVLDLFFQEGNLFGVLFVFLIHLFYYLLRLHLKNGYKLIEKFQVSGQRFNGFFQFFFKLIMQLN